MLATTDTTVATMTNVDPGAYAIFAKTIIRENTGSDWAVTCTLDAGGGSIDYAQYSDRHDNLVATLNMEVTRVFPATGSIVLLCRSSDPANVVTTKIVAIKVDSVTREAVTG